MNNNTETLAQSAQQANHTKIKVFVLAALMLASYYDTLVLMVRTWFTRDSASHGFLIPVISYYMLRSHYPRLKSLQRMPNLSVGIALIILSKMLQILGSSSETAVIETSSVVVAVYGLVLMFWGTGFFKALILPLLYLFLMVPILDIGGYGIHWPFQLFSSMAASELLSACGLPVLRNMTFIELPNITLEVITACSGLNYLLSMIAISVPLAYYTIDNTLKRVELVMSAILIGIAANAVRITFIGLWTYYYGNEYVHGPFHIFQGFFVSVIGFVFIFALSWLFSRKTASVPGNKDAESIRKITGQGAFDVKRFNKGFHYLAAIIVFYMVYIYTHETRPIPLKSEASMPQLTIGDWRGEDLNYFIKPFRLNGADAEIMRAYRRNGREVVLYVGYLESQTQGKKLISYHVQKFYEKAEAVNIGTPDGGAGLTINKTFINDGPRRYLALYWFQVRDKVVVNRYKAKFLTAMGNILNGRSNGAMIIVFAGINNPSEEKELLELEAEFVRSLPFVQGGTLP